MECGKEYRWGYRVSGRRVGWWLTTVLLSCLIHVFLPPAYNLLTFAFSRSPLRCQWIRFAYEMWRCLFFPAWVKPLPFIQRVAEPMLRWETVETALSTRKSAHCPSHAVGGLGCSPPWLLLLARLVPAYFWRYTSGCAHRLIVGEETCPHVRHLPRHRGQPSRACL